MPDDNLFRLEATASARHRLGDATKTFGVSSWINVAFFTMTLAAAGTFVCLGSYARKETVSGLIKPAAGVERITSLKPGTVKTVAVGNDQFVTAGQTLLIVSGDTTPENGVPLSASLHEYSESQDSALRQQANLKRKQAIASRAENDSKIEGLRGQIDSIGADIDLQQKRVDLQQKDADAAESLVDRQYISQVQLRQKLDVLFQSRQRLVELQQNLDQDRNQIRQLELANASSRLSEEDAASQILVSQSEAAERHASSLSAIGSRIVATNAGRVSGFDPKVGDIVSANQTLGFITPASSPLQDDAELWIPSKSIGFVHPGSPVRLMFDAFPFQTFGVGTGHVLNVSSAPLMPNELPVSSEPKEQMYKVTVKIDRNYLLAYGKKYYFTAGMKVSADIILDRRSFVEFLLDPIAAQQRREGA